MSTCTLDIKCEEGVFKYKGTREDGSAKWHFVANPGYKDRPPRRFMGLLYRKEAKK